MQTLFEAIVGSQAYGTAIQGSDIDLKSVHHASASELFGFHYRPQIESSKDSLSFEIQRYLELVSSANPTVLELLFSPEDCIQRQHPLFQLVINARKSFLTKKCRDSFGGYANAQIRKARGLDKKMNWSADQMTKKEPVEFCHIIIDGKTYKLTDWLKSERLTISQLGLVNLDHAPHCYALYVSWKSEYKGIFGRNSDVIITSSIPKGEKATGVLVYNRDHFQRHSREWADYQTWLKERNVQRYVDNVGHGQRIDGKNMLHVRRLLDMALEIPTQGLIVRRPNADFLISIRKGQVSLADLIKQAEEDVLKLNDIYAAADLPDTAPDVSSLLFHIRYQCLKKSF